MTNTTIKKKHYLPLQFSFTLIHFYTSSKAQLLRSQEERARQKRVSYCEAQSENHSCNSLHFYFMRSMFSLL
jgi:hypothetical protein